MATNAVERLTQPLKFRNGREAPNRLWLAPMTNKSSHDDGSLSDAEYGFLKARAQGGFGIVETCASHVSLDGQGWEREFGMFDDRLTPDWKRLAEAVKAHDSVLLGQAFHGGARALATADRPEPWSCSASNEGERPIREGTAAEIETCIANFAAAAKRLEAAGVDGLELHGAHGYLLCQFLSSELNQRSDRYGGSLENRARLLMDTMRAVKAAVSPNFIVGVRLSPEGYSSLPGIDIDEMLTVAKWLCELEADFIHISLWDGTRLSQKYPEKHPATLFRDALPDNVPLITAGGVWTVEAAMQQLDFGADAVALGRAAITNPDWPRRVLMQNGEVTRPPLTRQQLQERALGERFIDYMSHWPDFVAD